jgi:hypothetical protein
MVAAAIQKSGGKHLIWRGKVTEQIATDSVNRQATDALTNVLGYSFSLAGVVVACAICFLSGTPVPIERPLILLLASLFILVPSKSQVTNALRKITAFYLLAVPINELASQNFHVPLLSGVTVSYSAVVLLLCAAGFLLGRTNSQNDRFAPEKSELLPGWALAMATIVGHMVVLTLLLSRFYGYGDEYNLSVLGNLCLYLLVFIVIWEKLANLRFRQALGLVLAAFYCLKMSVNG